jgi:hypothetical protein
VFSKEYLYTAQALLRIAKSMTDETIANRLKVLAADYERRVHKVDQAEAAEPLALAADRAGTSSRLAKSD